MRKIIMPNTFKYILLVFAGLLLILLCSTVQQVAPPESGEYYYSLFLMRNYYTVLTGIIFFVAGLLIGYYFRLKPWLSGFCLILIIPFASLYEGIVYKGSHNLFPFEFMIYFMFALPPTIGGISRTLSLKKNYKNEMMNYFPSNCPNTYIVALAYYREQQ